MKSQIANILAFTLAKQSAATTQLGHCTMKPCKQMGVACSNKTSFTKTGGMLDLAPGP